jgi:hypothetical protein
VQEKFTEPTSIAIANKDEVVHEQVQISLYKPIIRPWEEIREKKHKVGISYEKKVIFQILDYTKQYFSKVSDFIKNVHINLLKILKLQYCH